MPYIKSYSNYVLKKKHQTSNEGDIYERDISTIGGRDNFAPGQVPMYRSGNFLITVNNDSDVIRNREKGSWEKNSDGDVWTLETLSDYVTDDTASEDAKIEIKKNYYDLRDYSYFGSCSELIRASISDIFAKFPGELYVPYDGTVVSAVTYQDTVYNDEGSGITSSVTINVTDINDIPANGKVIGTTIISGVPVFYTDSTDYNNGVDVDLNFDESGNTLTKIKRLGGEENNYFLVDNPFNINIYDDRIDNDKITDDNFLKYFANGGYKNYEAIVCSGDTDDIVVERHSFTVSTISADTWCIGNKIETTTFTIDDASGDSFVIDSFLTNEKKIVYLMNFDLDKNAKLIRNNKFKYRIRPKAQFIENFFSNLDNFEKVLLNRKSSPKYTATFNLVNDDEYGYYTDMESFTFPTTYGGYNLGSYDSSYSNYVSRLADIANYYDEHFSDNLYRSMTHEAIKNFDWSYDKIKNEEDEELSNSANKIAKVIRLFGREFDELLSYTNNINSYNVITYNNISNLPDYFLSDKLDEKGWDVKQVIPFTLHEYIGDNLSTPYLDDSDEREKNERNNSVSGSHLTRIFDQDTSFTVKPYSRDFDRFPNGYFFLCKCRNDCPKNSIVTDPDANFCKSDTDFNGQTITGDTFIDCNDVLRTRIKNYNSENEWTMTQINNEFMKRLFINSTDIWRHKGTQEGIEMILGMFGMKSKRWYDALPAYEKDTYVDETYKKYDFEIKEYTSFTKRIEDYYSDELSYFKYDWLNREKEISYGTYQYESYQGLPVTYRTSDDNKIRYLYPDFEKSKTYDGNLYYQMNGGWMDTYPYLFDKDNNLVINDGENNIYDETIRDIRSVDKLQDLFDIPVQDISNGVIVHVNDLSGSFAVVDGRVYNIIEETDGNKVYRYFTVTPDNGNLIVGNTYFDDYIVVSDPFASVDNKRRYILSDNSYDGTDIKIYLLPKETSGETIYAYSDTVSVSTFTVFEDGKYMEGDNFTNYFRINDTASSQELSLMGWEQIKDTDNDYYRINSEKDYFLGNNPHTGHYHYDNGHEYFTYFRHLFRYSVDNQLFENSSLMEWRGNITGDIYDNIYDFGFDGMIADNACNTNYEQYLTEDTKIHYFGNFFTKALDKRGSGVTISYLYNENLEKKSVDDVKDDSGDVIPNTYYYNLLATDTSASNTNIVTSGSGYGWVYNICGGSDSTEYTANIDGVTNQIVNNKVVKIIFYIRNDNFYSKDALEEIKYLQGVVVPYMTQLLPSGAILKMEYIYNNEETHTYTVKTVDNNNKAVNDVKVSFNKEDDTLMEYSGITEQGLITYTTR